MDAARRPLICVVVPTYKRPHLLTRCLKALMEQDFGAGDYEIIVADDRPEAKTLRAVQEVRRSYGGVPALHYLPVRGRHGPAAARNQAWRRTRAGIVAFTDDDTIPDRGWLREGLAALGPDDSAAAGKVIVPLPGEPTDYERDAARLEHAGFVTANCFVRRSALFEVGGFDERFRLAWREDSDLQFSLLEAGHRIAQAPRAIVYHPVRPAAWGVSLRQQRKVFFDALLFKKHPRLYRERVRAAPRWDYYATVGAALLGLLAAPAGDATLAAMALIVWLGLTARFCEQRLQGTSRAPRHVLEMIWTSFAIPPLSVFWRLAGAWHYRVTFL